MVVSDGPGLQEITSVVMLKLAIRQCYVFSCFAFLMVQHCHCFGMVTNHVLYVFVMRQYTFLCILSTRMLVYISLPSLFSNSLLVTL